MAESEETSAVDSPRPPGAGDDIAALGAAVSEGEGAHLIRVARELGSDTAARVQRLERQLDDPDELSRSRAAIALGDLNDRNAIAVLRGLLESDDPDAWALGVTGLRQSRERPGWLCLESVARAQIPALGQADSRANWAASTRLLMMGRTKTMDRLFRAADGHSRSIPASAAIAFVHAAMASLDDREREVMELRLGVRDGRAATPEQVAETLGADEDLVRSLESDAWVRIQSPRPYTAIAGRGR
ncbi:MAG: sigma factor-like helix-turn-helix DNA-binding protein [Dehalococcoidia bacterium]|nr:sigma factor-like helix-turn-helix DNA-binding protein [Dehalococcoidia bacterium]